MSSINPNSIEILLTPFKPNNQFNLRNRLVMGPATRGQADENHIPTEAMKKYYGRRAEGFGLIITECTQISPNAGCYFTGPGIYNAEQCEKWKEIVHEVHKVGSKIILQIWHAGQMSHPVFREGHLPISASATCPREGERLPQCNEGTTYQKARPMNKTDMVEVTEQFVQAAEKAIKLGFDLVEIHGANGYLLDSFLHASTNSRHDNYGGTKENKCRFVMEVVNAIVKAVGKERVGIRLSPIPINSMLDIKEHASDQETYAYLLQQLDGKTAYVHVSSENDRTATGLIGKQISQFFRENYKGTIIATGGHTPESGAETIHKGYANLIGFTKASIANPDLAKKIEKNEPLKEFTFDMLFKYE